MNKTTRTKNLHIYFINISQGSFDNISINLLLVEIQQIFTITQ